MPDAFTLEVGPDRLATLTFDAPNRPVNVFDQAVMEELDALIADLAGREDIGCLVLLSGKERTFIAGADVDAISSLEDPSLGTEASREGHRIFGAWQALPFPTVAAIRGATMGGGLELSLASTYRVVSDRADIRLGLPETRLGILPGWGGCVRLPKRVGIEAALDIILAGKSVWPKKALKIGLVDALLPDATFLAEVRNFALGRLDKPRKPRPRSDVRELLLERNPLGRKVLFDQARKKTLAQTGGRYPAPLRAIEVIRVAVEDGAEAGFAAEARALGELAVSPVSKNLIHLFHLSEAAKKTDHLPEGEPRPVSRVGVLGAGVMGGGIAQLVSEKVDAPVRLKDLNHQALADGMAHAARIFGTKVKKRRLTKPEAARKMALIRPTLDYSGFDACDLVIEAIVEKLGIKQKVFAEMAGETPEGAILASNTSSLSIDAIGADTPDRGRVVGMHFFNPVDKMPLVEVIAGPKTDPGAVHTIYKLTLDLGKTPVVVGDGPGFLVNRLLMFYSTEALWLLDEGHRIQHIDRAMTDWGMPMGPMALTDEVGIDVATHVAHILRDAFGERLPVPAWLDGLGESGRLGKKNGKGLYHYEGRKRKGPDDSVYGLLGLSPRDDADDAAALALRMVLPMVNEAARCLEEKIVADAGSLDLAMIMGTGFPPFRGGLCRWADREGVPALVSELERLAATVGDRFEPSEPLRKIAEAGGFYAAFGS